MKNKILDSDNKNGNRTKNYILRVSQNLESVCGENFKAIERGNIIFKAIEKYRYGLRKTVLI